LRTKAAKFSDEGEASGSIASRASFSATYGRRITLVIAAYRRSVALFKPALD
jgi:hypothetical protein